MPLSLDDAITVGAVFSKGTVKPVWFSWNGREIRVRELALTWKTRNGSATILHFSVSDGQGLYEIVFNTMNFTWKILNADCRIRNAE